MIALLCLFACSEQKEQLELSPSTKDTGASILVQTDHYIPLPYQQPQPVPELGGTVTLLSGKRRTVRGRDGKTRHGPTEGTLSFVQDGRTSEIDFVSGKTFSYADRNMAVYGVMSLELVIAPVGKYPSP